MLKAPGPHRQALKRYRRGEGVEDKGAKVTKILAMNLDQAPLRNASWIAGAAGRG
jgi:hypothetical protein